MNQYASGNPANAFPKPAHRLRQRGAFLIVAAVLALDRIGAECHQPFEVAPIHGDLDHDPASGIAAYHIAAFKDVVEKPRRVAHRSYRWLVASEHNLGAGAVNKG